MLNVGPSRFRFLGNQAEGPGSHVRFARHPERNRNPKSQWRAVVDSENRRVLMSRIGG
jgi:hypothetical protein